MKAPATTRPMRLKALLAKHRIGHEAFRHGITQTNGRALSRPAFSLWLNGRKPVAKTPLAHLQAQIANALRTYGVSETAIATAFDPEPNEPLSGDPSLADETPSDPEIKPVEPDMLSQHTKKHFGLVADPFKDDVQDPKDVFQTEDTRYVSQSMLQTARTAGLLCVVAESGGGKSTLRRLFNTEAAQRGSEVRIVETKCFDKTKLHASALCEAIITDLTPGVRVKSSLEARARQVEDTLRASFQSGAKHVMIIEEAHDLPITTLKYLKRFWEMESGMARMLAIILIAQPEIKVRLDERHHPELREFIRRCEVAELEPIDRHVRDYLAFKFARVQSDASRVLAANAYDAIVKRLTVSGARGARSMVYPLVVNNLVTRAMNEAAKAGMKQVTADVVEGI